MFDRCVFRLVVVCALTLVGIGGVFAQVDQGVEDPLAGNQNDAEQQLRKKLAETNQDPYVMHTLGSVLYRKGNVLDARKLWDRAAAKDGNLAGANVSSALELLNKRDYNAAMLTLQAAQKQNPNDPHVHRVMGDIAFLRQDFGGAELQYQQALDLNPELMAPNVWMGRFHERRGDWNAAEKYYKIATELTPERSVGWILLASVHFSRDRINEALEDLKRAEATDKDQPPAELRLAQMYIGINDFIGARKWLLLAVERAADNVDIRVLLGRTLLQLKLNDLAKQQFEAVLEKESHPEALIHLAEIENKDQHLDRAIELYRRLIRDDPKHVIANNNLAMIVIQQRNATDEALRLAEVAWQALPDNPNVQSTYGCALLDAGRQDDAKKILSRAIRRIPADPWARYAFGKILVDEKDMENARLHLEGCLILDPDFPRKAEVESLLETAGAS